MSVFEHLDPEPGALRISDLWEWARCDYFAGESADVVCERHKLSRSQFFERAKREGWLRRDQPRTSAERPTTPRPRPPPSKTPSIARRPAPTRSIAAPGRWWSAPS